MDEDTLKKLIEGMVRDALAANEADIKVPGKTGSDNLRKPLYNFKMNINKERMIAANWKMNMTKTSFFFNFVEFPIFYIHRESYN